MNQNQDEVNYKQTKTKKAQCGVIICQLIHISIIIAIIIITTLSLLNNQNSSQVTQWCTIELTLIIYHLIQLIYEMRNQFLIYENTRNFFETQECYGLAFTKIQSSNIVFFFNDLYIYGLFFGSNFYFRESKRKIPGSGRESICSDYYDDGSYRGTYDCIVFDYETIKPQYHGPYLVQLANLNVVLFAFGCFYFLLRLILLSANFNREEQQYQYNINIQSIKKESQILCVLFTLYYICRTIHSIVIYNQVINETLLYSIQAYIFYSLMMITVLVSIIIIIQKKFNLENYIDNTFITVYDIIDQAIYQNSYLLCYFWIMLIASFAYTCVGIHYFQRDTEVDDIVNYQNYVLADLIIAQMVLIFFMLFKYMIILIFCCSKFAESNINYNLIVPKNLNNDNQEMQFYDQQSYQGECTICLEKFIIIKNKTINITRLNCFGHHIFHSECIKNWLQHNKTCPLCNSIIDANLNI